LLSEQKQQWPGALHPHPQDLSLGDIGLDVHKEAIAIAVLNDAGKLVMASIIETKAATLFWISCTTCGESCM